MPSMPTSNPSPPNAGYHAKEQFKQSRVTFPISDDTVNFHGGFNMAFGIDDAIGAGLQIINKFITDPGQKQAAEDALRASLQGWDGQQTQVNATEAASASMFVAGWRPAIGWVCASALAFQYLVRPLLSTVLVFAHRPDIILPTMDDTLWQLMFGMLGMGGLRTFEKMKGITK
jgi:hypothetical protein